MTDLITLGQQANHTFWCIQHSTELGAEYMDYFHSDAHNIPTRIYDGKIFVIKSVKFIMPTDIITQNDIELINLLTENNILKVDQEPTRSEIEVDPHANNPVYNIFLRGPYIPIADISIYNKSGQKSNQTPVPQTMEPTETKEPEPEIDDAGSDAGSFGDLFG